MDTMCNQGDEMNKKICLALILLSCFIGISQKAYCEEEWPVCPLCRRANNQRAPQNQKAAATFTRGAMNTFFGWTEIIYEPSNEVKSGGNLGYGIGKGVGLAIKRSALGIGEMLTFWAPKGNKDEGYLTLSTDCPLCMGRKRSKQEQEELKKTLTSP
jgi:hypothetical protein